MLPISSSKGGPGPSLKTQSKPRRTSEQSTVQNLTKSLVTLGHEHGNASKKLKMSATDIFKEQLEGIDFDSWNDMDDDFESLGPDTNSGGDAGTGTESNNSFTTAATHLSSKKVKTPELDPGTDGNTQKRNLCRIVHKESQTNKMVVYNAVDVASGNDATLQLKDLWMQHKLPDGCIVNIVGVEINSENTYVVARDKGYLIVEPDSLVSVSLITHQLWCDRESVFKTVLQFFEGNQDILRGNICHELLAKVLIHKTCNSIQRKIILDEILKSPVIIRQAYGLKMTQFELDKLGTELLPYITKFTTTRMSSISKDQTWQIHKVRDIEDTFWNPIFGIKGKLDATIDIRKPNGTLATIPLEVKTGNPMNDGQRKIRDCHVGQLSLYSLLMSSRYKDVTEGLLYYVREDYWQECTIKPFNLQALIALRNSLILNSTTRLGNYENLPDATADYGFKCKKCEYKTVCSLFVRKQYSDHDPEDQSNGMKTTERKLLGVTPHLGLEELSYFYQWFSFITMEIEASDIPKQLAKLWNSTAEDRYQTCLSGLKLIKCWLSSSNSENSRQYLAKFEASDATNKNAVDIKPGEFLVIGTKDEVCVSNCTVEAITSDPFSVTVYVESDVNGKSRDGFYHLDKVNNYNPMFINYAFLSKLMEDSPQMHRLRQYIIHKKVPVIKPLKGGLLGGYTSILSKYNANQQRVITKSLATDSFLFVKGMPGTGKTETIVGLLRVLVELGKTVLLVAYTSTAVDNIMLKYKEFGTDFIRMGNNAFVQGELRQFSYHSTIAGITDLDEIRTKLNKPPIVATTLLSMSHEIFSNRSFDFAILDEISQSLPVTCIGALCKANKYILFGDPEQLPPVVVSTPARELGCDETLFTSMSTLANTVKLTVQYRMNGTIMKLANKLTYNDQMTCFSSELEDAYLRLPTDKLKKYISGVTGRPRQTWLSYVASKKLVRSVMFLDTSDIDAHDSYKNHSLKNNMEVAIATECLKLFLNCGLEPKEVGLIAPYTAQVHALRGARNQLNLLGGGERDVEVNTVDQYQGRDKMAIICSLTKTRGGVVNHSKTGEPENSSADAKQRESILNDKRRLNVAITRAKRKLVLIGHMEFLKSFKPLQALFNILLPEQIIHLKPEDVAELEVGPTPFKPKSL